MVDVSEWVELGERVREARLAVGLSQQELAARMGLERTMLAKIEAGTRRVDALELVQLSAALALPIGHFLTRPPAVVSRRHAPVVEDTSTGATRDSYLLEAALVAWLRDVQQIIGFGNLATPPIMAYPGIVRNESDARAAAMWLRGQLGLGAGPIGTLMDVCEQAGQLVLVTDLHGDGASLIEDGLAVAVVRKSGDSGRRRATGAHELGHFIMGDEYSSDLGVSASRQEREDVIDVFAAELLLPTEALESECDGSGKITRATLVKLAATYRTSWSLAAKQAQQSAVIEKSEARVLTANRPTRAEFMEAVGWEPLPDLESVRVPRSYARATMAAWRAGLVTSARATELMHGQISQEDLPSQDLPEIEP
jgi:transcriptional regulator with XRE-family HTH domain/Zn-dependent peptidase ImmA (M78 family)